MSSLKFDSKVDIRTLIAIGGVAACFIGFEYSQSDRITTLEITQKFQSDKIATHDRTLEDRGQWGGKYNERLTSAEQDIKYLKEYFKETVTRIDENTQKIANALNVKNLR